MLEVKTVGIPNIAAVLASINALRFISSNEIEPTQLIVPTWWSTKSITESWELKGLYIFLLLRQLSMDYLNEMALFAEVAEAKGFSKAAAWGCRNQRYHAESANWKSSWVYSF
ncbi:hypothetical protein [Neisseria subflava]|uniref:hypothetical protein n=1 Tax=Neisseria subflava TaxID=28449 RepID=UPI001F2BC275|nr:hypothetical protein [Neisseria subflava]